MSAGEMAASIAVLELPPRFSLSSQVRTESLKGMWSPFFFFPFAAPPANSAKAEITWGKTKDEIKETRISSGVGMHYDMIVVAFVCLYMLCFFSSAGSIAAFIHGQGTWKQLY